MANDTDYKRLYKNLKKENTKLYNINFSVMQRIEDLLDLLRKVKDGEVSPDKLFTLENVVDSERMLKIYKENKK